MKRVLIVSLVVIIALAAFIPQLVIAEPKAEVIFKDEGDHWYSVTITVRGKLIKYVLFDPPGGGTPGPIGQ